MIHVRLDRKGCRLRIWGHAQTAPYGQDLVCAAVSTLTLLAAQTVAGLTPRMTRCPVTLRVGQGTALVSCRPRWRHRRRIRALFSHWGQGFGLLAGLYPQAIDYVEKGRMSDGANQLRFSLGATHLPRP